MLPTSFRRRELATAALLLALPFAAQALPERASSTSAEALARLQAATGGKLLSQSVADEAFTAVYARGGTVLLADNTAASPVDRAKYFLAIHGAVAGITDAGTQLKTLRTSVGGNGSQHVHMEQMQSGVPVFGSRLIVHMNSQGITGMNGVFVKGLENLSTTPALETSALKARAFAATAKLHPKAVKNFRVESSRVMFYNTGLLQGLEGSNYLAYEVVVAAKGAEPVREQIILDANTGVVLNRINRLETVLHRKTYTPTYGNTLIYEEGKGPTSLPPMLSPQADPPFTGDTSSAANPSTRPAYPAIDALHIFAGGTWKMYKNLFGRDGYNADGYKPIPATGQVQESVLLANDQCPNAYWDGTSANYCPGFDLDDVVSHEWSHGYTEYMDGLVYQYQSGALNEAYSDIYGETYDLINGFEGTLGINLIEGEYYKTGGSRWVVGEDLSEQAAGLLLRDMWDPDDFPATTPGRVGSPNYECGTGDGGGVHTNSSVANHAYAMLVDGRPNALDTSVFNGTPVPKIGMIKAAHIFFAGKRDYQGPTTNFRQHADALDQACQDLKGVNLNGFDGLPSGQIITETDCDAVKAAEVAVNYRANVKVLCNYTPILQPEASTPALCPTGQAPSKFFSEGFNAAATLPTGWTTGMAFGNTGNTAIANWTTTTDLPAPHSGRAAFFKNDKGGDCSTVDHSARYWLETPAITVQNATSKLMFTHFMQSEGEFDGGNLKYAINGSTTWTIVPPAAMTAATGGYNPHSGTFDTATPIGSNTSPNAGQAAWTGSDQGEATGSWGTTIVNFAQFAAATRPAAGSTIKFRYEFAQDGCNGNLGWFVDQVDGFFCVANALPIARLTGTGTTGPAPLAVNFDASTSSDADAGDSVASYTLDFGDNSTPVTQATPTFSHSYQTVGNYTASLTVTDTRNAVSAVVTLPVTVEEAVQQAVAAFNFIERTDVKLNTFITSELIKLSGFTGSLPISVTPGLQYSVNGAPFTSNAGSVPAGATLAVRHVSSTAENTATQGTVTIGSGTTAYSTVFRTVTTTLDRVPDAFDFGSKLNQTGGSAVESDVVTLKGYDIAGIVPGPGVSYSLNGAAFTTARGTMECGNADKALCTATLKLKHTANSSSLGYTKSYITVGGVRGNFTTRTRK